MTFGNILIFLISYLISIKCNSIFIENVPQTSCIIYYGDRQVLETNQSRISFQHEPNENEKLITIITLNGQNITFKTSKNTPQVSNHPGCNYGLILHNTNIPAVANANKNYGCDILNINYNQNRHQTDSDRDYKFSSIDKNINSNYKDITYKQDSNTYKPNRNTQISTVGNKYNPTNNNEHNTETNLNHNKGILQNNIDGVKTNTNIINHINTNSNKNRQQEVYNRQQKIYNSNEKLPSKNPINTPIYKCTNTCTQINNKNSLNTIPTYINTNKDQTNSNYNPNYNPSHNSNYNQNSYQNQNNYNKITEVRNNSVIVYTFVNKYVKPLYPAFSIGTVHNYILDSVLGFLMPNQVRLYSYDGYWKSLIINPNSSIQCGFYDPFELIYIDCDKDVKKINKNRIYIMTEDGTCLIK